MPNHYHLLVKPLIEDGVSEFMKKIGIGYTNYFNIKNERSGALFQGKYKFVRIEDDEQLSYIPFYIHFNPAELVEEHWKEKEIQDKNKLLAFLKSYKWSSLQAYLGNHHFSSIINKEILADYLGSPSELEKEIGAWLEEISIPNHTNLWIE
ncbi:MAG: transposase [Candidatus Vogelbacteria bacterium]|nr:transposase [Candidatus Vogelbacteria bacterium]